MIKLAAYIHFVPKWIECTSFAHSEQATLYPGPAVDALTIARGSLLHKPNIWEWVMLPFNVEKCTAGWHAFVRFSSIPLQSLPAPNRSHLPFYFFLPTSKAGNDGGDSGSCRLELLNVIPFVIASSLSPTRSRRPKRAFQYWTVLAFLSPFDLAAIKALDPLSLSVRMLTPTVPLKRSIDARARNAAKDKQRFERHEAARPEHLRLRNRQDRVKPVKRQYSDSTFRRITTVLNKFRDFCDEESSIEDAAVNKDVLEEKGPLIAEETLRKFIYWLANSHKSACSTKNTKSITITSTLLHLKTSIIGLQWQNLYQPVFTRPQKHNPNLDPDRPLSMSWNLNARRRLQWSPAVATNISGTCQYLQTDDSSALLPHTRLQTLRLAPYNDRYEAMDIQKLRHRMGEVTPDRRHTTI